MRPSRCNTEQLVQVARRKAGLGSDWKWCHLEGVGSDASLVKLQKDGKVVGPEVVTDAEWEAEAREYERVTGRCATCEGEGRVRVTFSVSAGPTYGPCTSCEGSGKAPQEGGAA